jgi:hypothetical protein
MNILKKCSMPVLSYQKLLFEQLSFTHNTGWCRGLSQRPILADGYHKLSRRLARYHLPTALLQPPLAERSVTVSVSLRSPVVYPVALERQATLSATLALRISRPAWLVNVDHLCPLALCGAFLRALVRRHSHDYYGHSVSVEVALGRKSHVPSR